MLPLDEWPLDARRRILGVLTDIDDTLTTEGRVDPNADAALRALRAAGLPVFAITGRPSAWSENLLRGADAGAPCPLDAVVAENGAVMLWFQGQEARRLYLQDASTRATHRQKLRTAARRVLDCVPGAALAQDSIGRETDIAIDHGEFVQLAPESIDAAVALLRADGLTVTVSSIHVNAWLGDHDKLEGARWLVRERLGRDLDQELDRWVFVGDSCNDERLFGHFPNSVGVANVVRVLDRLVQRPRYVAGAERGAGFAEVAARVLAARNQYAST